VKFWLMATDARLVAAESCVGIRLTCTVTNTAVLLTNVSFPA
jgi:hypothetical protein